METSLPVAERPRRPEWMKVRAPSQNGQLLRRQEADPRRAAATRSARRRAARTSPSAGGAAPRRSRSSARPAPAPAATATSTRASRASRSTRSSRSAWPQTAKQMGLKHVVVTSVDRDDVPDKGAGHYAATIRALKAKLPAATVEVLTPDFLGVEEAALQTVIGARPDVFNHNIETVRRLHRRMRGAQGELRRRARAAAAGEGDRRLPGAHEERDHRRARRDATTRSSTRCATCARTASTS